MTDWDQIPRDEQVVIWKKDTNFDSLNDTIGHIVGRYVAGVRPRFGRLGTDPIFFPVCVDINGHTQTWIESQGAEFSKIYCLRYETLKNVLVFRLEDNTYYEFLGFHTCNNSKMYPKLNGKDLVYMYRKADDIDSPIVYLSSRICMHYEFPSMENFFGREVIQYMLETCGRGTKPLTRKMRLEDIT